MRFSLTSIVIKESLYSLIYIRMNDWNKSGSTINKQLFLDDQIHLNKRGYELLDSCIANAIAADLKSKEPK